MIKKQDFWQDLQAGEYNFVVASLSKEISNWTPSDWRRADTLGIAQLVLKQYAASANSFELGQNLSKRASRFSNSVMLEFQGASFWLAGEQKKGAEIWLSSINGILDKSITYTDFSGGVGVGLLLLYAGISLGDDASTQKAIYYLKLLQKKPASKNMPGQLIPFVLGIKPIEEIFESVFQLSTAEECIANSENDVLLRRQLCQMFLCMATIARSEKNEPLCFEYMARIAHMKNPLVQVEWYLARGEVDLRLN